MPFPLTPFTSERSRKNPETEVSVSGFSLRFQRGLPGTFLHMTTLESEEVKAKGFAGRENTYVEKSQCS